ncbi:MAG TPA: ribonuclease HII [Kiritimatiellia bacterium]|nr:ribonuclease HII [Kiritimatiellia bacterium]
MLDHERALWSRGLRWVAGLDEAGRGPLAGPVVAAALTAPPDHLEALFQAGFATLTDSKKLSPARREFFYRAISADSAITWAVGQASPAEIDALNILRATHLAMRRAVEALPQPPQWILVDGLPVNGLPIDSTAIVGGDGSSLLIAAASIIAKVTRDRIMLDLDLAYPHYGFARHKGYGTKEHLDALQRHGPAPCHRRSFAPVAQQHFNF